MDELEQIKQMVETFKETLVFLVEQEKIRGEEVAALNEKIDAVNDVIVNQIINPSVEAYQEEQFNGFKDKYGEQLNKFDDIIRTAQNDPEYDSTREAWNEIQEMPEEQRADLDVDGYVAAAEEGLAEYVDSIKESLGLSQDEPVEITQDENGEIEVKADTDGDGEVDDVVAVENASEEVTEEAPAEETESKEEDVPSEAEEEEEDDKLEVDPELQKELDNY